MYLNKEGKNFITILFLLSLSIPTFANNGICSYENRKGSFNVSIAALYLRPDADNLLYATKNFVPTGFPDEGSDIANQVINTTYDLGFHAEIDYQLPSKCYDINLAYTHFTSADHAAVSAPNFSFDESYISVTPFSGDALADTQFSSADSKAEFGLNVVDFDAGSQIVGNNYNLRLFAGLRYAGINARNFTSAELSEEDIIGDQQFKSYFKGVGPLIGAQGRYALLCGWGLDAEVGMALLKGKIDSSYSAHLSDTGDNFFWNQKEAKNDTVSVLEAKVGVDYCYQLNSKSCSALTVELGYQMSHYADAVNTVWVPTDLSEEYFTAPPSKSSLSFGGPYIGVKYYA